LVKELDISGNQINDKVYDYLAALIHHNVDGKSPAIEIIRMKNGTKHGTKEDLCNILDSSLIEIESDNPEIDKKIEAKRERSHGKGFTLKELLDRIRTETAPRSFSELSVKDHVLTLYENKDIEPKKLVKYLLLSLPHYGITGLRYRGKRYLKFINNNVRGLRLLDVTGPLLLGAVVGLLTRNQQLETLRLINTDTRVRGVLLDAKDEELFPLRIFDYPNLKSLTIDSKGIEDAGTIDYLIKKDRLEYLSFPEDITNDNLITVSELTNLKVLEIGVSISFFRKQYTILNKLSGSTQINLRLKSAIEGVRLFYFDKLKLLNRMERLHYVKLTLPYSELTFENSSYLNKIPETTLLSLELKGDCRKTKIPDQFFKSLRKFKRLAINICEEKLGILELIGNAIKYQLDVEELIFIKRNQNRNQDLNNKLFKIIFLLLNKQGLDKITLYNLPYSILYSLYNGNREYKKRYEESTIFFKIVNGVSGDQKRIREAKIELDPSNQYARINRNKMGVGHGLKGILMNMIKGDRSLMQEAQQNFTRPILQQFE